MIKLKILKDKVLLITGGTGSFGNVVAKKFLNTEIREIRIFSRDEKKQGDMSNLYKNKKLRFYIGNVKDYESICNAMYSVDYVFHAAALKQVPSCEFFPIEAVKTNILGTVNILNAAILNEVKRVIVLSTDKAVYPINAMGMSKALMEKVMIAKSRIINDKTVLCGIRYGNIIASRGSVVLLFIKQIKDGKPLTVTNPNMTRFMMSLEDAVELVLFAFHNAQAGDIFVQKSPSCTIGDLAMAVKELFKAKNEIRIIGPRQGEKLHETLLTREESARAEDLGNYFKIPTDIGDLNFHKYLIGKEQRIIHEKGYTSNDAKRLDVKEMLKLLSIQEHIQNLLNNKGDFNG